MSRFLIKDPTQPTKRGGQRIEVQKRKRKDGMWKKTEHRTQALRNNRRSRRSRSRTRGKVGASPAALHNVMRGLLRLGKSHILINYWSQAPSLRYHFIAIRIDLVV